MSKRFRNTALAIGLIAIIAIGAVYIYVQSAFGPGLTIDQTARILVHDRKFGMRARQAAIRYGDPIIPLIKKESNDFALLNGRNSFWIADVLGATQTDQSKAILLDLYGRSTAIARLTGAIGLAQHGALPHELGENSFLVKTVQNDPSQTETQLAIIALGKTKNKKALPCLLAILEKRHLDYSSHAYACEAVARIASPDAIPILRHCLASDEFFALPKAFRALISLGDRQAVPLAIARISPELKGYSAGSVVKELEEVTGEAYGYDRTAWMNWWQKAESEWSIPERFTKPWDEQKETR